MIHTEFMTWFNENLLPELESRGYQIKLIDEAKSDFGPLKGVQFETEQKGGHIYFYGSGFYNFHFYDFVTDDDLIEDTHGNYQNEGFYLLLEKYFELL